MLVSVLFVIMILLQLNTWLHVKLILKRDGPAKIEVNKRYTGILLDHAEAIDEKSIHYTPFIFNGYGLFSNTFFSDFENQTNNLGILFWAIRIAAIITGIFLLYQTGMEMAFYTLVTYLFIQSATEGLLSHYYYLRYYEVDFEITTEEDGED